MLTIIDRQMLGAFFKAYIVCLVSMLSLYVVVDLFTNLDDFTGKNKSWQRVAIDIGAFYGYRLSQIFDRLCEAIVLLAAMFTIAWTQRNNELVPLLSCGVSVHRVVAPVLGGAFALLGLAVFNQEVLVPAISDKLMSEKDDPHAANMIQVRSGYEPNGMHFEGDKADRTARAVQNLRVTVPESLAGNLIHITAKTAIFHPDPEGGRGGKWELLQTAPREIEGWDRETQLLEAVDTGRYLLHVREMGFDAITRNPNWFGFASTIRIYQEMQRPDASRAPGLAVLFHSRLVRPLVGMVLVMLGLSVILRDQNRNIFISAGMCLVLCCLFFGAAYTAKMLGDNDMVHPALAAWLPLMLFGPYALVLFDAAHT